MGSGSNIELAQTNAVGTAEKDPYWYKKAIIYQLHVRSFFDSNADGVGDFPGLTQKLDYLQDLGVTAIWLMPFYPSPLRDDGYDIADYYSINPIYGTLEEFRTLLEQAHGRGIRVITELVINHTSDQHPWFQRARRAPAGSVLRDYYVWSHDPKKYKETRIIFPDFEPSNWTWDPVANSYYWHRFFSHQPDLNFDNPEVHNEIVRILDFWLEMGVDGMRLDAIPYLYEREGTGCESLPETHAFLKKLRKHVDEKYGDRVFLAEANQWPDEAVHFFGQGQGDECHMAFHFPLMPRLFMSVRMEDRFPIIDILAQTPTIPETSQWAIFLRNHDELTLEMVTDEERDYMYRMYAGDARARINLGIRRRLAPLMGNDRRKIELLNMLLLSLPGTPVLYYGDEIGMGDNTYLGDRNGVRTPMHWSSDKNAGFSRATPQALFFPIIVEPEYHYESNNVEAQQRNPNSLLWWMKKVLALRKRWPALTEGALEFLHPSNRKVLAFLRKREGQAVLVLANLSRYAQPVELNLENFKDHVPIELAGHVEFPPIQEGLYRVTMAPHTAFWFLLVPKHVEEGVGGEWPLLKSKGEWAELLSPRRRGDVENLLEDFMTQQAWFTGRSRTITSLKITETAAFVAGSVLCFVTVEYSENDPEEYVLALAFASEAEAAGIVSGWPHLVLARVETSAGTGILYEASCNPDFWRGTSEFIETSGRVIGANVVVGNFFGVSRGDLGQEPTDLIQIKQNENNNSSAAVGSYFIKLIRRIEPAPHPEFELGRFLTDRGFPNIAAVLGRMQYTNSSAQKYTLAVLSERISETRTGWEVTLDSLGRFHDRVIAYFPDRTLESGEREGFVEREVLLGTYAEFARLLGTRTAELHLALAQETTIPEMAPELFAPFSQRSLYQSMRNLALRTLQVLQTKSEKLNEENRERATRVLALEAEIVGVFKGLFDRPMNSLRVRGHGNLHLRQVLHTGKDVVFVDFEGEADKPFGERRIKRSPVRDLAGIIRSFHYASQASLKAEVDIGKVKPEQLADLEEWSRYWRSEIAEIFLSAYQERVKGTELLPQESGSLQALINSYLLESCFTELNNGLLGGAPGKVKPALQGILETLDFKKNG